MLHRYGLMHWSVGLLLCCALLAVAGCGAAKKPRLVLLVTVDTLRADHLGAYGSELGLTPQLDALAAQSLRFDASYAPASYTLPSMASLHTGRYPEELGIFANRNVFRGSSVTLAEVLRLHGWKTGAAVSNYVLRSGTGIEKGFDVYNDQFTQEEANRKQPERSAEHTTQAALQVLDEVSTGAQAGVLLWVHYQDPHGPYLPPEDLRERFAAAGEAAGDAARELPSRGINAIGAIPSYQLIDDRHDIGFYRSGYAGEVHFVDREIGKLLAALEERGWDEDIAIVLTADHGESLGEDDYWFAHGEFLSDVLVRIPLLMRIPGVGAGTRDDVASMVDLLPTLLSFCGIEVAGELPGRNLLAPNAEEAPGRAYLASLMGSSVERHGWVEGGFKFVSSSLGEGRRSESLYALNTKAGEELSETEREEQRNTLRAKLDDFRSELSVPSAVEQALSPQDRQMLKQLGYLE